MEGVETCWAAKDGKPFRKGWMEGGQHFLLELHNNRAGHFLLCIVFSMEEKRFSLVFLEGRGLLRGWKILSNKLRSLGISSNFKGAEESFIASK